MRDAYALKCVEKSGVIQTRVAPCATPLATYSFFLLVYIPPAIVNSSFRPGNFHGLFTPHNSSDSFFSFVLTTLKCTVNKVFTDRINKQLPELLLPAVTVMPFHLPD